MYSRTVKSTKYKIQYKKYDGVVDHHALICCYSYIKLCLTMSKLHRISNFLNEIQIKQVKTIEDKKRKRKNQEIVEKVRNFILENARTE